MTRVWIHDEETYGPHYSEINTPLETEKVVIVPDDKWQEYLRLQHLVFALERWMDQLPRVQ